MPSYSTELFAGLRSTAPELMSAPWNWPGDGERWVSIDWADGQHLRWQLDGQDGWCDPPPWGEEHGFDSVYDVHNEADDFIICPECGQAFDARDLRQVQHHQRARDFPAP
jgi:hypothetical protein